MTNTEKIQLHKDWKIVKEIKLKKDLERELEDILAKRMESGDMSANGGYKAKRRSIFKKSKK